MSSLKLTADGGGGTVAIKGPASTTGNNAFELTVPGNASGTILTSNNNTGKILQVVQVAPNGGGSSVAFSTTQTSGQHVSALDTSITPVAAGSKLFVMINIRTQNDHSSDVNGRHSLSMARSIAGGSLSSTLIQGFNGIFGFSGSSRNSYLNHAMTLLDTPSYSLGQAIVYKFYLASDTSSNTAKVYLDSSSGPRSQITVMEVAA